MEFNCTYEFNTAEATADTEGRHSAWDVVKKPGPATEGEVGGRVRVGCQCANLDSRNNFVWVVIGRFGASLAFCRIFTLGFDGSMFAVSSRWAGKELVAGRVLGG